MDRRVERTKTAIQNAYFDLLLEGKGRRITISEIARRANIDRKTFYLHYDTVEDIVREFAQDRVNEVKVKVKEEGIVNEQFSTMKMFEIFNEIVEENMPLFQFVTKHKEYDFFFDEVKEAIVTELVTNYQIYFGYPKKELTVYAEFYIAGIVSVYVRWIRDMQDIPRKELAQMVGRASYGGLKELLECAP